jgi:hypothetical protein
LDYLATHTNLSQIRRGFAPGWVHYKKGCTRLATACDKVYQLLALGQWFSPGTPASSTTKTDHHDIAEILLKVALKHPKQIIYLYNCLPNNSTITVLLIKTGKMFPIFTTTSKCLLLTVIRYNQSLLYLYNSA